MPHPRLLGSLSSQSPSPLCHPILRPWLSVCECSLSGGGVLVSHVHAQCTVCPRIAGLLLPAVGPDLGAFCQPPGLPACQRVGRVPSSLWTRPPCSRSGRLAWPHVLPCAWVSSPVWEEQGCARPTGGCGDLSLKPWLRETGPGGARVHPAAGPVRPLAVARC